MDEQAARDNLTEVCHLAYSRGYISGTEGNFSLQLAPGIFLTTPRSICKGRIKAQDLVLANVDGEEVERHGGGFTSSSQQRCSTEFPMHLMAYKMRPDVKAVVHAHPTVAVGFSVAGLPLSKCILPEVVCSLGIIPIAPYATPSTSEVALSIAELIKHNDALVLDHHGALTVGSDIWDAFYKLETLEHHAQTMLVAHLLGGVQPLYAFQVQKLLDIRGVYGYNKPLPVASLLGPECSRPDPETD